MSNSKSDKERTGLYWYQLIEIRAVVVFEQDYACGECGCSVGQIQGDMHLHHIDENPKHNFRGNLLVLCPQCHAIMHGFKTDHFSKYQPLYDENEPKACPICGRKAELKSGLCFRCDLEHYSNYKQSKKQIHGL